MITETVLTSVAQKLATRLIGRRYGSLLIRNATASILTDVDDYLGIQLDIRLDDPAGETWPPDDIADLYRGVEAEARTFPEPFPVYVRLQPTTEAEQEPESSED